MTRERTGRKADWVDYVARWMIASEIRPGILGPRLVMCVSAALFVISVTGIIMVSQGQSAGDELIWGAIATDQVLRYLAWREQPGSVLYEPLDERELAVALKAFAIGGWLVCLLVGFWALALGSFAYDRLWYPGSESEWLSVAGFLGGILSQITTFISGFLTPPYAAELREEA